MADRNAMMQRLAEAKANAQRTKRVASPGLGMPDLAPDEEMLRLPPRELRAQGVGQDQPATLMEKLANLIAGGQSRSSGTMARPLAEALTGTGYGQFDAGSATLPHAKGERGMGAIDVVPGVSEAISLLEGSEAAQKGDWTGAALGIAGGAMPPGVGKGGKLAVKGGREALAEARGASKAFAPGTQGLKAVEPLEHGRIAQRFPKPGAGRAEDPLADNLLINMDVLKQDPKKAQQAADIVSSYPATTNEMKEMHPNERLDAFRDSMADNYTALWDMMGKPGQKRASQWYLGANRIAGERADEVGIPLTSAAGAYAALSPQKDWFMNVDLGDSVLRTLHRDPKTTRDMLRLGGEIYPDKADLVRGLEGRRVSNMNTQEQAMAIRLWDEAHGAKPGSNSGERSYHKISPEGDYGDLVRTGAGELGKPAWNTQNAIEKAVAAAQSGGDMSVISPLMGEKHKVRNFYNNIAAPIEGEPFGDITADTHQIAAGLFRPLSGKSPEVLQGLQSGSGGIASPPVSAETGLRGLYPLYADATRKAAHERGVATREMQSVPWEAIRSLYPREFKKPKNVSAIDDIWAAVGRGDITPEEARRLSVERAGGFKPPKW